MNSLKNKLKNNQLTIGSWITMNHISIIEIMASAKFDWLTIDMEHSAIELNEAQSLMATIQAHQMKALVRVGKNDEVIIKRIMDAGADGVIVPMVNSRADAERAVSFVQYPPVGKRGVGLARAQSYGPGFNDYKKWLETESVIIAQIEHIDAINNIREIISTPGIDGIIIGPYDLSASMGIPGQYDDPKVKNAIASVVAACKEVKFPLGFHVIPPDYKEFQKKVSEGFTFVAFSIDFLFLGEKVRSEMQLIKKES